MKFPMIHSGMLFATEKIQYAIQKMPSEAALGFTAAIISRVFFRLMTPLLVSLGITIWSTHLLVESNHCKNKVSHIKQVIRHFHQTHIKFYLIEYVICIAAIILSALSFYLACIAGIILGSYFVLGTQKQQLNHMNYI